MNSRSWSGPRALLTDQQAAQIYTIGQAFRHCGMDPLQGGRSSMLAKKYGVSPKAIRDIWNRRTWQNGTRHLWAENDKPMIRSKKSVPSSRSSGCALSTIANATNLCCRFPGELPSLRSSRPWCCSSLTDFHLVNVPYANSHIDQTQFAITSSSPQIAAQQSPLDPAELYGPAIHDGSECSMKRCLYFREAHTVNPQHVGRSGEVCTIPSLTPTSSPFAAHQHLPYIDRSNAQAGDGSGGGAALATNWQDPFGPCAADQADGCGGTGWEGPFGPCLPPASEHDADPFHADWPHW